MILSLLTFLILILVLFYGVYYFLGFHFGNVSNYADIVSKPYVSLVVATYNERELIEKKIENLLTLNYPHDKLELVFVDCSTDGTLDVIKSFAASSSLATVVLEEKERKGLASALNLGYAAASGEIVIKSDCDQLLNEESVGEIVKPFSDKSIGAVTGRTVIASQSKVEIGYRSIFDRLRTFESNLDSTYVFNPFCAFRKTLFEPIRTKSVADDAEIALKIRKKGYKTVFAPSAVAYDESPLSLKAHTNIKSRRAQGHIQLILQNLDVFLNPKYGKFGLVIFPANFFMMILSPWMFVLSAFLGAYYLYTLLNIFYVVLIGAGFLVGIYTIYTTSKPKIIAGFLDAQINLIIGSLQLIAKGPSYAWSKERASATS
jgi:cellulose synthase/poly-beta-1,6-N-acetylglucosamine synthase-like glycosyltransferase